MAYETGTATGYADYYNKLITFLTTNASLVAAGQQWTVLSNDMTGQTLDDSHLLRGPGLSAIDQIHIRIGRDSNPGADIYGLLSQYFVSYNPTFNQSLQPGQSSAVGMALWDNPMPYWFIANGRRFICIAKVSTVYTGMYCGFYLPYSTPSELPYPMIILGSQEDATSYRWSTATHEVGGFWDPAAGNGYARDGSGTEIAVYNYQNGSGGSRQFIGNTAIWPYDCDLRLRENYDGTQSLLPTIFHTNYNGGNVYGELQSVFFTSAFGLGSEDTVTIDSKTYLIVQSVYRTDRRSYAAILLE